MPEKQNDRTLFGGQRIIYPSSLWINSNLSTGYAQVIHIYNIYKGNLSIYKITNYENHCLFTFPDK